MTVLVIFVVTLLRSGSEGDGQGTTTRWPPPGPLAPPPPPDAPRYADRRRRVVTPSASSPMMNSPMMPTSNPMVGSGVEATSLTASTA